MSKVIGIFDYFDNLDTIPFENISRWLKTPVNQIALENFLANRMIYPQTVPASSLDMEIDLAILREALRHGGIKPPLTSDSFINTTARKILIPSIFVQAVPDLVQLVWVFIDAFLLGRHKTTLAEDLWTIVLAGPINETLGTVIIPDLVSKDSKLNITIEGQTINTKQGGLVVIPCIKNRCHLQFKVTEGRILGLEEGVAEVYGGKVGVILDTRKTL